MALGEGEMQIPYVMKKRSKLYYVRKVPRELRKFEPRTLIRKSLNTSDPTVAAARAAEINKETERYFASLANGGGETARQSYENTIKRARYYGVIYRPAEQLAEGPLDELLERLTLADKNVNNQKAVESILGGAKPPTLKISDIAEIYFEIAKSATRGKSDDQVRRWKNPRLKALKNFTKVIGNRAISDIDRNDSLNFRDWWLERLNEENLTANSANKDFGHLRKMIRVVAEHNRIDYNPVFSDLNFPEDPKIFKLPFTTEFIKEFFLAPDALSGLPQAGVDLIHLMIETGARPSELIGLDPTTELHIDKNIPYIYIVRNRYRTIKNKNSDRELPLVGRALTAAQNGAFERFKPYRSKSLSLTNLVGKYFRDKNYLPSPQHTLYSLRHSFSDRLVNLDCPERTKHELLGHTYSKPSYGQGPDMAKRLDWLQRIQISNY